MSTVDLVKLAAEGRAYSASRPWTEEELDALLALERERDLGRATAAEWIRNGVLTVEAYDLALKKGIEIKSLDQIAEEGADAVRAANAKLLGAAAKPKAPKGPKAAKPTSVGKKRSKK